MQTYIEASLLTVNPENCVGVEKGLALQLWTFGAIDYLCQLKELDEKDTLKIYKEILMNELGEYSEKEAEVMINSVISATGKPENKHIMKQSGDCLQLWITGEVPAAQVC